MTRINCVSVTELVDKHLLAEYRELPRVFKLSRDCADAPKTYTLGPGHVKFFYDKLFYCYLRQCDIVNEMIRRGFKPTLNPIELFENYYSKETMHRWNIWFPDKAALKLNTERLNQRILEMEKRNAA